jgi:threonine dehydrogenase-like Zn-dependent dehydrogenase
MEVGVNVTHLEVGDAVVPECIQSCQECPSCKSGRWVACTARKELGVIGLDGGYSEYVVVPGRFVNKLPQGTSLRKAALCEPLAVALKGIGRLERAWRETTRKSCAVVGAGPIGHLCAKVLAMRGHSVTVFDRNPLRRSYFEGTGISTDDDLRKLGEFEVLVEVTGDPDALSTLLQHSSPGASILLLGLPYAKREFSFEDLVAYDKTIIGSVGSGKEDFEAAISLLDQIDMTPLVETVLPLEKFREGWEHSRKGDRLKVILEVDSTV